MKKMIGLAMLGVVCILPSVNGGNEGGELPSCPALEREISSPQAVVGTVTLQNSYQCGHGETSVSVTVQNYASPYQTYTFTTPGHVSGEIPYGYYKIVNVAAFCGGSPQTDAKIYEVSTGTSSSFTVTADTPNVYIIVGNE